MAAGLGREGLQANKTTCKENVGIFQFLSPKFVSLRPENNSYLNVRKRFNCNTENPWDKVKKNLRNGIMAKNPQNITGSLQVNGALRLRSVVYLHKVLQTLHVYVRWTDFSYYFFSVWITKLRFLAQPSIQTTVFQSELEMCIKGIFQPFELGGVTRLIPSQ